MNDLFRHMTVWLVVGLLSSACSPSHYHRHADEAAYRIINDKRQEGLGRTEPFSVEPPEDELRRRLLLNQGLPYDAPASLGRDFLPPIDHWPEKAQETSPASDPTSARGPDSAGVNISLTDALQIAASNSRDYQNRKEDLFRTALDLDFQRSRFDNIFGGSAEGEYIQDRSDDAEGGVVEGSRGSLGGNITRTLLSGITFTTRLGWDLVRMLQPTRDFATGLSGDISITVPLLRGAGRHIASEPLTQAEREALYAVWDFERFKKEFAVTVADEYLAVLQSADQVRNQEENYRRLITSSRRAERLAEAGKLPRIQVDQSVQNELRARDRWVAAHQDYAHALDQFKIQLGLPADADLQLDRNEFQRLEEYIKDRLPQLFTEEKPETTPLTADAPIHLEMPGREGRGPLELDPDAAVRIALDKRLDLRVMEGRIVDAQRGVVIAADTLRPELTLFGAASVDQGGTIGAPPPANGNELDFNNGIIRGLLTLDLPLDRAAEAMAYRESYLALEGAIRDLQELEDRIKLAVRDQLRSLEQTRDSLQVQYRALRLAEHRVTGAALMLEAGRAEIRDLLDAQESLLTAQNSLTSAMVEYRISELAMQRDLGVLQVDGNGLWQEHIPNEE